MKTAHLKLTSAIAFGGTIQRAGTIVEVSESEARNLLDRGKAVLATADDRPQDDPADEAREAALAMLSKMTKAELLEAAGKHGIISVGESNTKAEIIAAFEAAAADQAADSE